jgi:hypothetical protein
MPAQAQQAPLNANESRSRPPFAFKLKSNGGQSRLIVYEILSGEQAEARQQRFERVGSDIHIKPIDEAFTQATLDAHGHLWDGWQAIRVASATSQRYTILRNRLLSEVIDVDNLKQEGATFVSEAIGVRVGLATLAVSPLSKRERMRRVVEGIASMADEECYYWHTLCRSPNDLEGAKALRTLFS